MIQEYKKYNNEDHEVWGILFDRQTNNLQNKACREYLDALVEMRQVMHGEKVPDFRQLDKLLLAKTGWSIEVVPGLIPVEDFFALLAQRRFCSSTWLRKKSQLDYLQEPDMFHDTFGHIPLLMNEVYAEFVYRFGQLGLKYMHNVDKLVKLQRLYWFTIEFGLFDQVNSIYGAGIISSFGETNHIWNDGVEVLPYNIERVMNQHFINSEIQPFYFAISNFEELYHSIDEAEKILAA